ncbi:hypothetical protein IRY61_02550, partial [Candidatus Saccharibacteria bacterium]|nr:hypothetical protein [Candidatus Saccharibacteria bacterium]
TGQLKSAAEPHVYVTTRRETDTGYGDTAVPIRANPGLLQIDDEFPDGRVDYRIDVGRPGGSVKVLVGEYQNALALLDERDALPEEREYAQSLVRPACREAGLVPVRVNLACVRPPRLAGGGHV